MYLLRRHCQIGWFEVEHVLPEWEVKVLLEGVRGEFPDRQDAPEIGDDASAVPTSQGGRGRVITMRDIGLG